MENIKEFISSGIIEMYCMGLTSEGETARVTHLATLHKEVRDEIEQVTEALSVYAAEFSEKLPADLKDRILRGIESNGSVMPPKLADNSSIAFWNQYLKDLNINPPADYDPFFIADLPSDGKQITYAVWAKKGAWVEETHDDQDEWLFVLRGTCTMTINGKVSHHKAGDLVAIPLHYLHKAEATSAEPVVMIGQRIAA